MFFCVCTYSADTHHSAATAHSPLAPLVQIQSRSLLRRKRRTCRRSGPSTPFRLPPISPLPRSIASSSAPRPCDVLRVQSCSKRASAACVHVELRLEARTYARAFSLRTPFEPVPESEGQKESERQESVARAVWRASGVLRQQQWLSFSSLPPSPLLPSIPPSLHPSNHSSIPCSLPPSLLPSVRPSVHPCLPPSRAKKNSGETVAVGVGPALCTCDCDAG